MLTPARESSSGSFAWGIGAGGWPLIPGRPPSSSAGRREKIMHSRFTGLILAGILLVLAHAPCLAAGHWRTTKPAGEKTSLPKGKTLFQSGSHDGRYLLLVRDE